ncbi:MAG: hypothetical protein M3R45_09445 [Pseudomonadota bacterium]|nr:hypothetical protein [Pseudomonadota bacterium]
MKGFMAGRRVWGAIGAVIMVGFAGLLLWSYHAVFSLGKIELYSENGLLENIQAMVLAAACLAFLRPVIFEKRPDRLILLFCTLVCYAFVLREIDGETLDVPEVFRRLGSGTGRNMTIAAALLVIVSFFVFNFSYQARRVFLFLRSLSGALVLMGGAFLFLGEVFEKSTSIAHHAYFEEIAELVGDVFILLGGLSVNSFFNAKNPPA